MQIMRNKSYIIIYLIFNIDLDKLFSQKKKFSESEQLLIGLMNCTAINSIK